MLIKEIAEEVDIKGYIMKVFDSWDRTDTIGEPYSVEVYNELANGS